ncbi:hypothetical protein ACFSSA_02180 [Luteolibacter algae]|uniref:Large, multifunctional secreted protein n=1 Tax=Luteolibacter algae TaxID=454151 RepID=A0ABW5D360_9BACT
MNTRFSPSLITALAAAALHGTAFCEEPKESDYYTITSFQAPEGVSAEVTGITLMPEDKVAVCTRRGQVWTIENAFAHPRTPAKWNLFAEYLHEPLGLAYRDGWLYAVQRPEVTRIKDEDGDGRADYFECVSDDWGINGTNHEYTFGSRFDKEGNLWCALCLTGSFTSDSMYRGWILRVNEDGTMTPTASGVRSPGGVGFNAEGDAFYTDNQGAWNGSSSLKWIKPGSYQGNPNGNIWYEYAGDVMGEKPPHPDYETDDRIEAVRERTPTFIPPAVIFPHQTVGNSPTGIEPDLSEGKFGPFGGQVFVAEQTLSRVHRVFLEKVNGFYQGAMFPFLEGFSSGNIGLLLTESGVMFTGGSNRGWGAKGGKPYSFERVDWTGKTPFEVHEMRVRADGFELTFTQPIDRQSATADALEMEAFTYGYGKKYGSPELDIVHPQLSISSVADDGKSLVIKVDPMTKGHVHALSLAGLRNEAGQPLLHADAYYTLNEIPSEK